LEFSILIKVDGELRLVCNIIQQHELNLHTKSILAKNLSDEEKITLLKIKLDYIINKSCQGQTRFLLEIILGTIIIFTISNIGGFALILEGLYRLFQEGKII